MTLHSRLALSAASCLVAATLAHADSTSTLYLGRIGFYDSGYTATDGTQYSVLSSTGVLSGRYVNGISYRYNVSSQIGQAAWIYDAQTGATTRIGLYTGSEFTSSSDSQTASIKSSLGNYVIGNSSRFNGSSQIGQASWYADATTGVTTRIGLVSADFTSSGGIQTSNAIAVTSSGYARGTSSIYTGTAGGTAIWLADLSTGTTTRVGLYGEEFTRDDAYQYSSSATALTESGYLSGTSARYNGGSATLGQAAWAASAATGTTYRIGLYTGSEFTKSDRTQTSTPSGGTESGYIIGTSNRFNVSTQIGQAAWVATAATGTTYRIGLYTGSEFTKSDGTQSSSASKINESGYVIGTSNRYNVSSALGLAAWIANAATGTTTRTGFYTSAEYTKSDGTQSSNVNGINDSGYVYGNSAAYYTGVAAASVHTWIANATTSSIVRTGLYGTTEFRASTGVESSSNGGSSQSSYVYGYSTRYNGGTTAVGQAAWVADTATGATTRIGLYTGEEFTRADTYRYSTTSGIYENGYLFGTSDRFNGGSSSMGNAAWVANAATGVTTRVGLTDVIHTSSNGYQNSGATGIVNGLYVYGLSTRYTGTNSKGQNAWIFNLTTGTQVAFDFSVRASDNFGSSTISGITDSGLAYGTYKLFDGETNLGDRAFIWTEEWGTVLLDDAFSTQIAQNGWDAFMSVNTILPENLFFGQGTPGGATAASQAIYVAQVVPEPGTLGLIGLGLAATLLAARRRPQA